MASVDAESLHTAEVQRGTRQIMLATGVSDLRNILAVRRAFQLVPVHRERLPEGTSQTNWEDLGEFWAHVERTDEDEMDKGGVEGLAAAHDKTTLRARRSFELLLTTGRVIRFEVSQICLFRVTCFQPFFRHTRAETR